jgi:hypothetical protein
LVVYASEEEKLTVFADPNEISGAVEALTACRGDEPARSQDGTLVISPSDAVASEVEFTGTSRGDRPQACVEDSSSGSTDRLAKSGRLTVVLKRPS